MTDTSKLNAEAAAISKQSPAIRAFAIDSAQATVDLNARLTRLEQQVAPSGFPKQGVSVPLNGFQAHRSTFLPLMKELTGGHPMFLRLERWTGGSGWDGLVAEASGYGVVMMPLCSFAKGAPDAPTQAQWQQNAAESALMGWVSVGNEPNLNGWTAQDFAVWSNYAYDAAHLANQNVKVIGPDIAVRDNTAGEANAALQWLKDFKAAGGKLDILAVNLYDAPPRGLWAVVDQLKAVYPGLPLFSLESGYWNSADTAYTTNVINGAMDWRDQGHVDSVLYYSLFNDASPGGFGLLDSNGVKRPAFATMQARAAS